LPPGAGWSKCHFQPADIAREAIRRSGRFIDRPPAVEANVECLAWRFLHDK
jgi:hypothetical protein